jgi:CheY-like chemotaxis protein
MARVLLVDDDRIGLEIRKLLLEHAGHEVFAVPDTPAAREACRLHAPGIAILDVRVPEVEDGLALIRDLREAAPTIKLIVLSGWPADLEDRGERALVNEILLKPVHPQRLFDAVAAPEPRQS